MRFFVLAVAAIGCLGAQTAEQTYKNIVQLKGTPADQLGPAKQVIASSLGVDCAYCHVPVKMEADDKPPKKTAREMMAMTAAINQSHFRGQQQVTCYSCHHGVSHPVSIPPVMESDAAPKVETRVTASTATADQIVERYVEALGGADAIRKITTRVQKGMILAGGNESPIEVLSKAPNKRVSISRMGAGESFTAFDGTGGWMGNTGRPARVMSGPESAAAGLDAEFYLALRLKEIFPQLRRGRAEAIDGTECEVLIGSAPGKPQVRLYFDRKTGLLARMVRYADTPVGRNPTQIDYADYRAVDGVQMPFRWTLARPNGRFTIQVKETQVNVPIEDARFEKPAGDVK
jgi:photosynthetic reaction center cytochrome c subunit